VSYRNVSGHDRPYTYGAFREVGVAVWVTHQSKGTPHADKHIGEATGGNCFVTRCHARQMGRSRNRKVFHCRAAANARQKAQQPAVSVLKLSQFLGDRRRHGKAAGFGIRFRQRSNEVDNVNLRNGARCSGFIIVDACLVVNACRLIAGTAADEHRLVECFGQKALGKLLGIVIFVDSLGGALGTALSGQLKADTGSYLTSFTTVSIVALVGIIGVLLIKPLRPDEQK